MNQDQRKFLIERVNKTFMIQKKKIEDNKLIKPSLNNYLVAAFLDNSIQFNDIERLKVKMRETVLRYGASDKLIKEKDDWRSERKGDNLCEIVAEDLFIIPESYKKALAEYQSEKDKQQQEIDQLEAQKDTILLKIQIGSNQVLDKLITQVDNLADLNIMNSQFLLQ
jgi:methylaspartate ammonia-lyase